MDKSFPTPKKFPILSLLLLLVAYISFGWFLSDPDFPELHLRGMTFNIPMVLAIAWIWLICSAFISPIDSFKQFVTRWFKSDTVAFLSIFMLASMATFVLFWMHIFLYILTIVASEALARVDFRTSGYANWQAFVTLLIVSLVGLVVGWAARDYLPVFIRDYVPVLMSGWGR